ncbi:hypothetical protein CDAR_320291 [Caerostris darwini]|uniref:Uncharacterized protein n=1 Tax=Caerostris darwini TaxID=1538125 RepID=A0AAV4PFI2_9ARAC|nr:hypothetical protein CDAR_320291 [Caerostris darwini]
MLNSIFPYEISKSTFKTTAATSIAIFGGTTSSRDSQLGTTRVGRKTLEINLQTRPRPERELEESRFTSSCAAAFRNTSNVRRSHAKRNDCWDIM